MLHICKKAKGMKNQTTKKEYADTDKTKLRDTTNISSRSSMKSEGLNISWMYPGTILFHYFKTVFAVFYSVTNREPVSFSKVKWIDLSSQR